MEKVYGSIEAGGTKFVCAVGNENLEIINTVQFATRTPEETLKNVINYFSNYKEKLVSISIASFGPIDIIKTSPKYLYYSCKHRKSVDGYKCNFKYQLHANRLDRELLTIIGKLMSTPTTVKKLEKKINIEVDTREIDELIDKYQTTERQLNGTKHSLMRQIDSLDVEDKHYDQKFEDLNSRLDNTYDKIDEIESLIIESKEKKDVILKEKMTSDNIIEILLHFDQLIKKMEDIDKKRFCQMLIEKIEINKEKSADDRWIKAIHFKLPLIDENINFSLDNSANVEAVVKLSKK